MGFRLNPDEYFTGLICEPGGDGKRVVVGKATRAAAVKMTRAAAERTNWDWVLELKRQRNDEDGTVDVLGHWSSVTGELPPASRPANEA